VKGFFVLLLLVLAAYGQQKEKVAIINTVDDGNPPISNSELSYLTKKLRGIAVNTLPQKNYDIMTDDYIIDISGSQEDAEKKCEEAGGCLAKFGREIKVHYIAQARIGRFGKDLTIAAELYDTRSSKLLGSLEGEAKDVYGLMSVLEAKAPDLFRKMLGTSGGSKAVSVAGGISGVETSGGTAIEISEHSYVASVSSDPQGASLSFNGMPDAHCTKTPCNVELGEGSVRIIANLEQYEIADTTISIKQNKQSIHIRLKPNFGVLEIKPAYSENIGHDKGWSLVIGGKGQSSYENRLSPGNHDVKLSHECYEDIIFKAGINKGSREVFDVAKYLNLKTGGLVLSAEKEGEPVSEVVFVNGKQVGETPFSGAVPVCAEVGIGSGKSKIDVKVTYNQTVRYKHEMYNFKDYLDRGIQFASRGDYEKAIMDFTKALKLQPNMGSIYTLRGRAYVANASKVVSSTADFSEIVVSIKGSLTPKQTEDYDRAIDDFTKAIELEPNNAVNYRERGRAYSNGKKDDDKAIADCNQAIRLNPNYILAYNVRGNLYKGKKDYGKAIEDFSQAIRLDPNFVLAYASRGDAYSKKGDYGKAIEDYSQAIRLNPNDALNYASRGYAYSNKGNFDKAIADYNQTIRLEPNYALAYNNRGWEYNNKGDYDKSIADYNQAIILDSNYVDAYNNRGYAYYLKKDYDKAIADYNKAINLDPNYEKAKVNLENARKAKAVK